MLRTFLLLTLWAASPVLTSSALAGDPVTKEDLDLQKAEVQYAKSVAKSVEKLSKKWHKNDDKNKDNLEVERELKVYYRNELAWLRAKGIPTVDDDAPQHPAHPEKVLPEPPSETPKLEELRDICVTLKDGEIKDKGYSAKLTEYVDRLWDRYNRKERAYDKAKDEA